MAHLHRFSRYSLPEYETLLNRNTRIVVVQTTPDRLVLEIAADDRR